MEQILEQPIQKTATILYDTSRLEDKTFFCYTVVDKCCKDTIRTRFDVLILSKGIKYSQLARDVCVDKAYISRVCNGKLVPPVHLMIRIAKALGVDSRVIWP